MSVFFAPEIGRFLAGYSPADVRHRVTANPREGQPGEQRAIEAHRPRWFLYRSEYLSIDLWTGHSGENHMVTPATLWALFMVHAYVYNESGTVFEPVRRCALWDRRPLPLAAAGGGDRGFRGRSGGSRRAAERLRRDQPPVVVLAAPANGTTFSLHATLDLAATTSDPDGLRGLSVEFLINGKVAGAATAAPFTPACH